MDAPSPEESVKQNKNGRGSDASDGKRETVISTLASLKLRDMTDSSDEEEEEAFYAGGSVHSGQQILGPKSKKKKDIVTDLIKSAKSTGAEVVESTKPSTSRGFSGTGYKLGQAEGDTEIVRLHSSSSSHKEEGTQVVMKLWKEGFTVNDGPLRKYEDPESNSFLDSVRQGMIPLELTREIGNGVIHLDIEDHHKKSYSTSGTRVKPFTGKGYLLGSPAPPVVSTNGNNEEEVSRAKEDIKLDPKLPRTTVSIRLADGSRITAEFNHTHTIADIRHFINAAHPEYAEQTYSLRTTLPPQQLADGDTLQKAGILNSVITQKLG